MAAVLASSRGLTVSCSTKGLFFMFTLLSLVCLSSALIDKDQLEKFKDDYQKLHQQLEKLKIELKQHAIDSKQQLTVFKQQMDFNKEMLKTTEAYIDREEEQLGGKIEENLKKLQKQKEFIEFLEEQQAEL